MSTSLGALAQGDKLHRLLIFFSNRAVYAQVLRKVDNHVSSDVFQFLSYLLLKKMTFHLCFVRADCGCGEHNRESAEGKPNKPRK